MASLFCCTILVLTLASNLNMLVNSKKAGNVVNTTCLGGGKGGDAVYGSLQFDYYFDSCPIAEEIIFSFVENAVANEPRMAASLLRLHFHDCFVNVNNINSFIKLMFFFVYLIWLFDGFRDVMGLFCWTTLTRLSEKKPHRPISTLYGDSMWSIR